MKKERLVEVGRGEVENVEGSARWIDLYLGLCAHGICQYLGSERYGRVRASPFAQRSVISVSLRTLT
jgi:hypothetical protein